MISMKNVYVILIFFICVACKENTEKIIVCEPPFEVSDTLRHHVIHTEEVFGSAMSMFLIDSVVFIEDQIHRDSCIWGFHVGEKRVVKTWVPKGRGPGEVNALSSNVHYFPEERCFMVYDPNYKKMIEYNDSAYSFVEYKLPVQDSIFRMNFVQDVVKCDHYFVCMGTGDIFRQNKRFIVLDSNFQVVKALEGYPFMKDINLQDISEVYQYGDEIRVKPDGSKFVFGSYIGGVLEIFDLDQLPDSIPLIKREVYYRPVFDKDEAGNILFAENTQCGFENIYVTDNAIYALIHDFSNRNLSFPDKLVVYDWQGNWKKTYGLDWMTHAICVDEKNQMIYAMAFSPEKSFHLVYFVCN